MCALSCFWGIFAAKVIAAVIAEIWPVRHIGNAVTFGRITLNPAVPRLPVHLSDHW